VAASPRPGSPAPAAIFAQYAPPFDLRSDMLFAAALCPTAPLRRAFPDQPFLSLAGHTPLLLWFSRVKAACFGHPAGGRRRIGGPRTVMYQELNVVALLRRRAMFVPGIYATSELTIRIGHGYGMPKQPTAMRLRVDGARVAARVDDGPRRSYVRARRLGAGRFLAILAVRLWPLRVWPARFPRGGQVRALIRAAPRLQPALIPAGRLALDAAWLPRPVLLLPLGLYASDLLMRLPPP
jgi:hypothetical protein